MMSKWQRIKKNVNEDTFQVIFECVKRFSMNNCQN